MIDNKYGMIISTLKWYRYELFTGLTWDSYPLLYMQLISNVNYFFKYG